MTPQIVYVKSLSELKKEIKAGHSLIKVKDEKFKAKVIKSAMKKGRLYDYNGKQIVNKNNYMASILASTQVHKALAEVTIVTLTIIGIITILGLYAIYKEQSIKVVINKDGTVSLETNKIQK